MDKQGLPEIAIFFRRSQTGGALNCGSCTAKPIKSYSLGSASSGVIPLTVPGSSEECNKSGAGAPRRVIRTVVPSLFIKSASGKHTKVELCPAISSFVDSNDP